MELNLEQAYLEAYMAFRSYLEPDLQVLLAKHEPLALKYYQRCQVFLEGRGTCYTSEVALQDWKFNSANTRLAKVTKIPPLEKWVSKKVRIWLDAFTLPPLERNTTKQIQLDYKMVDMVESIYAERFQFVVECIRRILHKDTFPTILNKIMVVSEYRINRAFEFNDTIVLPSDASFGEWLHEIIHSVEHTSPLATHIGLSYLQKLAKDYNNRRTQNSPSLEATQPIPIRLLDLTVPYQFNEYMIETTLPREMLYCSKFYINNDGKLSSSEILSMGCELMLKNPLRFGRKHWEYFNLLTGILDGFLIHNARLSIPAV